jgi:hypothetical protein
MCREAGFLAAAPQHLPMPAEQQSEQLVKENFPGFDQKFLSGPQIVQLLSVLKTKTS